MTFDQFKVSLDARLGLKSTVFEDTDGNQYLEYLSPTGILLFSLYVKQQGEGWIVQPMGDVLPEIREIQ